MNNPLSLANNTFSTLNALNSNGLKNSQLGSNQLVQQYQQQMENLLNQHNSSYQNTSVTGNAYLNQIYNTHSMFNNSLLSTMFPNMYTRDNLFNHNHNLPISFEHLLNSEPNKSEQQTTTQQDDSNMQTNVPPNSIATDSHTSSLQTEIEKGRNLVKDHLSSLIEHENIELNFKNKLENSIKINEDDTKLSNEDQVIKENQYHLNRLVRLNSKDNKSNKRSLDSSDDELDDEQFNGSKFLKRDKTEINCSKNLDQKSS